MSRLSAGAGPGNWGNRHLVLVWTTNSPNVTVVAGNLLVSGFSRATNNTVNVTATFNNRAGPEAGSTPTWARSSAA